MSVLVPEKGGKGKNYAVYKKEKTAKAKLKLAVDTLIPQVSDFEELLARLQAEGFTIKRGKYVSCLVPGQERFTRLKTLGADYTEEAIRERIEGKRTRTAKAPKTERGVSLLIDIENSIKAAQSRGYEQWAKIHNLKQAAKTMNFITEHKIEQYTDLTAKIAEIQTESEQAADALKSAEKRLADMAVLIKNVSTFQKTKPAYDAFSQLQHSFFTRVFTLRLCRGVSRLIPVILHQQDKRKVLCTRRRSARSLWKGCALQAPVIPRPCKAAQRSCSL